MITSDFPTPGKPRTTHSIKRQAEFLGAARVDVFHFQGERRLANYAAAWVEARRRLRRGHYDLVHPQFGRVFAIPSGNDPMPFFREVRLS